MQSSDNHCSLFYLKVDKSRKRNMIVIHGLMGNASDFVGICEDTGISNYVNSYIIDCRNHGKSPHKTTNSISDLAHDLYTFIKQRNLHQSHRLVIMGHSMGAMAAMRFTEKYPEMQAVVDRIIIIDINCIPDKVDQALPKTIAMLKSMNEINLTQPAQNVLQQIQSKALTKPIAQIIKSNISIQKNKIQWICNLPVLINQFDHIANFQLHQNIWRKPIQVIYGCNSKHIDQDQISHYCRLYPQMSAHQNFHKVEAGHWTHLQNTQQFLKIVQAILQKDQNSNTSS